MILAFQILSRSRVELELGREGEELGWRCRDGGSSVRVRREFWDVLLLPHQLLRPPALPRHLLRPLLQRRQGEEQGLPCTSTSSRDIRSLSIPGAFGKATAVSGFGHSGNANLHRTWRLRELQDWELQRNENEVERCHCEGCEEKAVRKRSGTPWVNWRSRLLYLGLLVAWLGFAALAWKVSHIEVEAVSFEPYTILGLDSGATDRQIKKAYRTLSLKLHPDRGGDPKAFVRLTKAYQALTDEEAKKNWDQYGNPDGPGATTFGIALPKWLVSKEYGLWVLAAYGLVFMIILPTGVGVWWYNSIKYSADSVLMDTMQLYGYMFHKTQNMILRRIIMVLGASFEFSKSHNKVQHHSVFAFSEGTPLRVSV